MYNPIPVGPILNAFGTVLFCIAIVVRVAVDTLNGQDGWGTVATVCVCIVGLVLANSNWYDIF